MNIISKELVIYTKTGAKSTEELLSTDLTLDDQKIYTVRTNGYGYKINTDSGSFLLSGNDYLVGKVTIGNHYHYNYFGAKDLYNNQKLSLCIVKEKLASFDSFYKLGWFFGKKFFSKNFFETYIKLQAFEDHLLENSSSGVLYLDEELERFNSYLDRFLFPPEFYYGDLETALHFCSGLFESIYSQTLERKPLVHQAKVMNLFNNFVAIKGLTVSFRCLPGMVPNKIRFLDHLVKNLKLKTKFYNYYYKIPYSFPTNDLKKTLTVYNSSPVKFDNVLFAYTKSGLIVQNGLIIRRYVECQKIQTGD